MHRALLLLVIATGCRQILGIEDAVLRDGSLGDGSRDGVTDGFGPDGGPCYGAGLFTLCVTTPATPTRTFASTVLDTSSSSNCDLVVSTPSGQVCVIVAVSIEVPTDVTVRAVGSRPLVFIATESLLVTGDIDASSAAGGRTGPGIPASCAAGSPAQSSVGGGGGGAGGSFAISGGGGGAGDSDDSGLPVGLSSGGTSGAPIALSTVRAGCPGVRGGDGAAGSTPSVGGAGGGAVYLIAGTRIHIAGTITANGVGGTGGSTQSSGGAGGGSGGLIGLDAPNVEITGIVAANGGGGGEGGAGQTIGTSGTAGTASTKPARGGGGATLNGGDGGNGGSLESAAQAGMIGDAGGGGGGGSVGYVYLKTNAPSITGTVSPAASVF